MRFQRSNELTINMTAGRVDEQLSRMTTAKRNIKHFEDKIRSLKMERKKYSIRSTSLQGAIARNSFWDHSKIVGGDKVSADAVKELIHTQYQRCLKDIYDYDIRIENNENSLESEFNTIKTAKLTIAKLQNTPNLVLNKKALEHELRNNDVYAKNSLILREHVNEYSGIKSKLCRKFY